MHSPPRPAFSPEARIGWLLRGWRLSTLPTSSVRTFAALLADAGLSADPSRLSRWETGRLAVPYEVVEGYELVLDLPRGGLSGVAAMLRRVASGSAVPHVTYAHERLRPRQVERLLDVVLDGAPTGRDWFDLGMSMAVLGDRLMLPGSSWSALAGRLLRELSRSVGIAYVGRMEAAVLFGGHPSAKRALVHSIGEHVTRPDSLVVADPLSLLQEMPDPRANDLVLRLLTDPFEPNRVAAEWTAAAKVVRGHFDAEEMLRLERTVAGLVRRDGLDSGGMFNRLVDLVEVMPAEVRERVSRAARPPVVHPASWLVRELTAPDGRAPEPMLELLVEEALSHADAERRFLATLTVGASPARGSVAAGCAAVVARSLAGEAVEPCLLHRLMTMLTVVAGPGQRDLLERLVAGSRTELEAMALTALAHLEPQGNLPVPGLRRLVLGEDDAAARTALYCAGMTGNPCLGELASGFAAPEWRRRAAAWWLEAGPAIHEGGPWSYPLMASDTSSARCVGIE